MRSFAIDEPGSSVRALYATLQLGKIVNEQFQRFQLEIANSLKQQMILHHSLKEKDKKKHFCNGISRWNQPSSPVDENGEKEQINNNI